MLEAYRYSVGKFQQAFIEVLLTGSDVDSFLQNQSTYNFSELQNSEFHLISFLDPQGRIEFYAWALKEHNQVLLLVPVLLKEQTLMRLEKFLISEDVTIEENGIRTWMFVVGPKAYEHAGDQSFKGTLFEEPSLLMRNYPSDITTVGDKEIDLWRTLNGWPSFDGKDFTPELVNNLRLYDLSVSQNKGCYPGQETVSKIATRRGAAYSPVLIETCQEQTTGPLYIFDKKIGEIERCYQWEDKYYSSAKLLRDFRVAGMKLSFLKDDLESEGIVRYFPLLPGSAQEKAQELYHAGLEAFKFNDSDKAQKYLSQAIELDPKLADAYESLGVLLGRLERFPEAIELMDHLTRVDPSSVLAHTNKSLFLMKMGKIEEAEEQKSLATIKSFQKFGDEAKLKEQILKEKKAQEEEWSKRESMFMQVLEIDDEDTLANYGIGSIAVERQNWHKAVPHLERVIKADPTYSVAYLALGKAYKGLGLKDQAMTTWKEGIVIAAKKGDLMPANQMQFEIQSL